MLRCGPAKKFENIYVISWRGPIYTVEEVSDLLGIPRPTLYRYLREYSIPHLRRSGKISIPEDSFDRIREARDLHKEGLGTESVRRVLREGGAAAGSGELSERLDSLSETLKDLQEKSAAEEPVSSPALRTMLARQSLLISAVFNLTEMVEELLLANGKPRKMVFGDVAGEVRAVTPLPEYRAKRQLEGAGGPTLTVVEPVSEAASRPPEPVGVPARRGTKFGHLARRRRRQKLGALAGLAVLLVVALLIWYLPSPTGDDSTRSSAVQQVDRVAAEAPPPAQGDAASASDDGENQEPAHAGDEAGAADNDEPGEVPAGDPGSVAAGSEVVRQGEVPDVRGQGVEEAAETIADAGYTVAAIRTQAGPEEAGTATGTDPEVGTAAEPGTPVTLIMSGGSGG